MSLWSRLFRRNKKALPLIEESKTLTPELGGWCQSESFQLDEGEGEHYLVATLPPHQGRKALWQVISVTRKAQNDREDLVETFVKEKSIPFEEAIEQLAAFEKLEQAADRPEGRLNRSYLGMRHYEAFCRREGWVLDHVGRPQIATLGKDMGSEGTFIVPKESDIGEAYGQTQEADLVPFKKELDLRPFVHEDGKAWLSVEDLLKREEERKYRGPGRHIPLDFRSKSKFISAIQSKSRAPDKEFFNASVHQVLAGVRMSGGQFSLMNSGAEYITLLSVFDKMGRLDNRRAHILQKEFQQHYHLLKTEPDLTGTESHQKHVLAAAFSLYYAYPEASLNDAQLKGLFSTRHAYSKVDLVKFFLERGHSVSSLEKALGENLLEYAVSEEDLDFVDLALQAGAEIPPKKQSELCWTVARVHPHFIGSFALAGYDVTEIKAPAPANGNSIFEELCKVGATDSVTEVLRHYPNIPSEKRLNAAYQALCAQQDAIAVKLLYIAGETDVTQPFDNLVEGCLVAENDRVLSTLLGQNPVFLKLAEKQQQQILQSDKFPTTASQLALQAEQAQRNGHNQLKEQLEQAALAYDNPALIKNYQDIGFFEQAVSAKAWGCAGAFLISSIQAGETQLTEFSQKISAYYPQLISAGFEENLIKLVAEKQIEEQNLLAELADSVSVDRLWSLVEAGIFTNLDAENQSGQTFLHKLVVERAFDKATKFVEMGANCDLTTEKMTLSPRLLAVNLYGKDIFQGTSAKVAMTRKRPSLNP